MKNIYGFYHVWLLNGYEDIVYKQLLKYKKSNLPNITTRLHIGLISDINGESVLNNMLIELGINNYVIYYYGDNAILYEFPTLNNIKRLSLIEDFYCYYFHTKGMGLFLNSNKLKDILGDTLDEKNESLAIIEKDWISNNNFYLKDEYYDNLTLYEKCVKILNAYEGWKNYLEFFVIERYDSCLLLLDKYDAVGPHLITNTPKHFRGNFWWSKSDYIKKLPEISTLNNKDRVVAEMWITLTENKKFFEPHTLILKKPIFAELINNAYKNEKAWNK